MRVVLSGYFGYDNVGDEAILFSIIRALRKLNPTIEITVLSNNPAETAATYGVDSVNRWSINEVRAVFKSADGLISGGGSLMQDATSQKTIPYYAGIIKLAQMAKVPVFVYAQGMGPIYKTLGKWLVKSVFNKCAGITVRDEASAKLLKEIGVRLPVSIVPDPVVGLGGSEFTSTWLDEWLTSTLNETTIIEDSEGTIAYPQYVTVSVRDWESPFDFKLKVANALDQLVKEGLKIVFIPMHGEHDVKASKDVLNLMTEEATIAPGNLSIEEKIAVIGGSKLLIGQRLHSLIFSAIEHIPFIALSYDPKIDAFANIVNQPIIGHVEKDTWDSASLAACAMDILNNYEEKVVSLTNLIDPLQESAENTAQMALEAFK